MKVNPHQRTHSQSKPVQVIFTVVLSSLADNVATQNT